MHLLLLLIAMDTITGIFPGSKNNNLWTRNSLFWYAQKMQVLVVITLANVIDQNLGLNGAITYATVLFLIAHEGMSIIENMAELCVLVRQDKD